MCIAGRQLLQRCPGRRNRLLAACCRQRRAMMPAAAAAARCRVQLMMMVIRRSNFGKSSLDYLSIWARQIIRDVAGVRDSL